MDGDLMKYDRNYPAVDDEPAILPGLVLGDLGESEDSFISHLL